MIKGKVRIKEFYTSTEFAKLVPYPISQPTLFRYLKRGKIKAWRTPGGHFRIPKEELAKFIKGSQSWKNKK